MPQYWRIYMYQRNRDGISPEQLQCELGIPAEEIAARLEAARLGHDTMTVKRSATFTRESRSKTTELNR